MTPYLKLNGDTSSVGLWVTGSDYATVGITRSFTNAVPNVTGLVDPAPNAVYQSVIYNSTSGVGSDLRLTVPVDEGTYTVRLHFFDPYVSSVATRRFDIRLNGTTVRSNYSIYEAAGNSNTRATIAEYSGIVSSQGAISLSLLSLTSSQAILSGIELLKVNALGQAAPVAGLEVSSDGGTNWAPIVGAGAVPIDRNGLATFNWIIPSDAILNANYKIRATTTTTSNGDISARTLGTFLVANSGTMYYVSTTGDNRNSGKAPDQPVQSLSGLIDAYDLDAGDVINVAAGSYRLYRNTLITSEDSGVTIRGSAGSPTILDRANANPSQRVIELQNADGITLDSLRLTGAETGVAGLDGADNDDLTIRNSQVFGNNSFGVLVGSGNDRWTLTQNKIYGIPGGTTTLDNQPYGIYFPNASTGIASTGTRFTITAPTASTIPFLYRIQSFQQRCAWQSIRYPCRFLFAAWLYPVDDSRQRRSGQHRLGNLCKR